MRLEVLFLSLIVSSYCFAEDLIVFRNGDVERAHVMEILQKEVKYKRSSNPNGPIYTVDKSSLLSIKYENGEKETFDIDLNDSRKYERNSEAEIGEGTRQLKAIPADNNDSLLAIYNNSTVINKKSKPNEKKLKTNNNVTPILGFTDGSILSDENIMIEFVKTFWYEHIEKGKKESFDRWAGESNCFYELIVRNKSDNTIYIDLGSSFRLTGYGMSEPFYDGVSITNNVGKQNGGSIGLGSVAGALGVGGVVGTLANGIGIGGGSSNSTSITTSDSRIVTIPPHGVIVMPKRKKVYENGVVILSNEEFYVSIPSKNVPQIKPGEIEKNRFTPLIHPENVKSNSYFITYSTKPDFSTYTSLSFGLYCRGLWGNNRNFDLFISDDGQIITANPTQIKAEEKH